MPRLRSPPVSERSNRTLLQVRDPFYTSQPRRVTSQDEVFNFYSSDYEDDRISNVGTDISSSTLVSLGASTRTRGQNGGNQPQPSPIPQRPTPSDTDPFIKASSSFVIHPSTQGTPRVCVQTPELSSSGFSVTPERVQQHDGSPSSTYSQSFPDVPTIPPSRNFQPVSSKHGYPIHTSSQKPLPPRPQMSPYLSPPSIGESWNTPTTDTTSRVPGNLSRHLNWPSSTSSWPLQPSRMARASHQSQLRYGELSVFPDQFDPSHSPLVEKFQNYPVLEKAHSWFTKWFVEWWLFEIISWAFGASCTAIIVFVLWKYDQQPIPAWKMGLTLNTFVSVFSGLSKAALILPTAEALGQLKWDWFTRSPRRAMDFEVLDSASRGPWGSFVLLTRTKGITLASIGAAIILLSLPFELFFQQIISLRDVSVVVNGPTKLSRSIYYFPPKTTSKFNGVTVTSEDVSMSSAIVLNWIQDGKSTGPVVNCPSGNCTWDPFYTMTIQSACKEVPPTHLEQGCYPAPGDWLSSANPAPGSFSIIPSCGWYLTASGNSSRQLLAGYAVDNITRSAGEALVTRFFPMREMFSRRPFHGGSISFQNVPNPILDFIVATTPGGAPGVYKNTTPIVQECVLSWAVSRLRSTFINSTLEEEELDIKQLDFTGSPPNDPWVTPSLYGTNFSLSVLDPISNLRATFGLDNTTARKTIQALDFICPSTVTAPDEQSMSWLKNAWRNAPSPRLVDFADSFNPWLPPNSIPQRVEIIAKAMTDVLRSTRNPQISDFDFFPGVASDRETRVHIRWAWVTLPAIILLFSFIFLTGTVARSSREDRNLHIWKTSALAMLFYDVNQDRDSESNGRLGHYHSRAKRMEFKLGP